MIHIIETNVLPEKPAFHEALQGFIEAEKTAHRLRVALYEKLHALPQQERIAEVMWLYWRDRKQVFLVGEMQTLLGLAQADFRELAAEWQPSRVETCTICKTRPSVVKQNRNGMETAPHCETCAKQKRKDDYWMQRRATQVLLLPRGNVAGTNYPAADFERALLDAFGKQPTGATFDKVLSAVEVQRKRPIATKERTAFEEAFDRLVARKRLHVVSTTSGANSLWAVTKDKAGAA